MKIKLLAKNNIAPIFYYIPLTFVIFFTGFMLLRFPETASQGISDGVDMSLGTLIPSLYPFMVLSTLIIELGIFEKFPSFFGKFSRAMFSLGDKSLAVIILSLIGGLPLGCKMTSELYEKGQITRNDGKKNAAFLLLHGSCFYYKLCRFIYAWLKRGRFAYLHFTCSFVPHRGYFVKIFRRG